MEVFYYWVFKSYFNKFRVVEFGTFKGNQDEVNIKMLKMYL